MTVIGMVLVAFGCAWFGFRAAGELRKKERGLVQLIAGLKLMEQELELDAPDLTTLMERLEQRTAGAAKQLFQGCRLGMVELDRQSFAQLWSNQVRQLDVLGPETLDRLNALGETLGQCDCRAQCRMVATVYRQLEDLRSRAEQECRQQGKLYRLMGLSGGAFLVILLL